MSDSTIHNQNEKQFDMLWRKKEKLSKIRQQEALLRTINESAKIPFLKTSSSFDIAHFTSELMTHSNEFSKVEYRLDNLEEKVQWLFKDRISTDSNKFLEMIKDEFSLLPFVKEIHGTKTESGYNLVIVYDNQKSSVVLPAIMKTKLNLKKKLPTLYLELTVLSLSDFNKKEWESRQMIFQRT